MAEEEGENEEKEAAEEELDGTPVTEFKGHRAALSKNPELEEDSDETECLVAPDSTDGRETEGDSS